MADKKMELSPNIVATYLRKSPESFTKADIVEFIRSYGIKMVNFMYPAEDGRVKTLNFIINSLEYLETILSQGERRIQSVPFICGGGQQRPVRDPAFQDGVCGSFRRNSYS